MKDNTEVIAVKKPNECSETELKDFAAFVCAGGEVTAAGLGERIRKAEALVFLSQEGCLKGIAAIKNPEREYKNGVFQKAHATVQASEFPFELGWVFVLPSSRLAGLSHKLVKSALAAASGRRLFATSHSNNIHMHKVLKAHGFSCHGEAYLSGRCNRELLLFISEGAQQAIPGDAPKADGS